MRLVFASLFSKLTESFEHHAPKIVDIWEKDSDESLKTSQMQSHFATSG